MKNLKWLFFGFIISLITISCSDNSDNTNGNVSDQNQLTLSIMDAPIDNAEVTACFVTISEIYLDEFKIEGFNKTTVDLLALQNGNFSELARLSIDAQQYTRLGLVLDADQPDGDIHPYGCYILDRNDQAHPLLEENILVTLNADLDMNIDQELMLDFNLRKAIFAEDNNGDRYNLVETQYLDDAIRVTSKTNTHIKGESRSLISYGDQIIVYAYSSGSFSESEYTEVDIETSLQFRNAISSTSLDVDGKFQLSFLAEGDYELHFFVYDYTSSGEMEMKGKLEVESVNELLDLTELKLNSETNLELSLLILGLS